LCVFRHHYLVCLLPPACYLSIEFAHVLSSLHYAFAFTCLLHIYVIQVYFAIVALPPYLLPICLVHAYFIIIALCLLPPICCMFALFAHVLPSLPCVFIFTCLLHVAPFTIRVPKKVFN
jgi:hypothetical protein